MKNKKAIGLFALMFGMVSSSYGIAYNDYDLVFSGTTDLVINGGESFTGNFDIVDGDGGLLDNFGYNPATETIIDATVSFGLTAFGTETREYVFSLDTEVFSSGSFDTGFVIDLGFFPLSVPFPGGTIDEGPLDGSVLLTLDSTGMLNYTVENTGSSYFNLGFANLDVIAAPRATPDAASTFGLFGLGMFFLAAARKRIRK